MRAGRLSHGSTPPLYRGESLPGAPLLVRDRRLAIGQRLLRFLDGKLCRFKRRLTPVAVVQLAHSILCNGLFEPRGRQLGMQVNVASQG